MDTTKTLFLAAALAALSTANAQTTAPPQGDGDPERASSPHQRAATGAENSEAPTSPGTEPSAASSRHQIASAPGGPVDDAKLKMAREEGAKPATFVKKAALGGMTEVELAKVAQSKAQDAKVKAFADRMIRDHGKANEELATLAKAQGLQVPASLDAEHQSKVKELSGKSGADFDAAYSKHMVMDHAKTIALFEGAATGSDTELAAFAAKTLPTLKEHKRMADALPSR